MKIWKRRWFVLTEEFLFYYNAPDVSPNFITSHQLWLLVLGGTEVPSPGVVAFIDCTTQAKLARFESTEVTSIHTFKSYAS